MELDIAPLVVVAIYFTAQKALLYLAAQKSLSQLGFALPVPLHLLGLERVLFGNDILLHGHPVFLQKGYRLLTGLELYGTLLQILAQDKREQQQIGPGQDDQDDGFDF